MEIFVNVGDVLTELIKAEREMKQGDIIAPTLLSIYFAMVLLDQSENSKIGIMSRYLVNYKTGVFCVTSSIRMNVNCLHTLPNIKKQFMDRHSHACKGFRLSSSLDKIVAMFQPPPCKEHIETSIYMDGHRIKVVDSFVYLGSSHNRHCSLDDEVALRIKKAPDGFTNLKDRVWSQKGIKRQTKSKV